MFSFSNIYKVKDLVECVAYSLNCIDWVIKEASNPFICFIFSKGRFESYQWLELLSLNHSQPKDFANLSSQQTIILQILKAKQPMKSTLQSLKIALQAAVVGSSIQSAFFHKTSTLVGVLLLK
jgi:hypothetical protein